MSLPTPTYTKAVCERLTLAQKAEEIYHLTNGATAHDTALRLGCNLRTIQKIRGNSAHILPSPQASAANEQ